MSHPRRVVPGASYLITRRAYQRTFRLRPDPLTTLISEYCAAWAAAKTGVLLHAFVVLSNHHHLVVSDPLGALPDFLRELHRTIAKALNAAQGERENLWSAEPASAVLLPTLADVLDKIAYCAANPVAAALVRSPEAWPGVNLWQPETRKLVRRPSVYFDPNGDMPAHVELRLEPPAGVDASDWRTRVDEAVAEKVREAQASVARDGGGYLGARAVKRQSVLARAQSPEAKRSIHPVVAARDASVRETFVRIEKAFRAAYKATLARWRLGDRAAQFPFGTWWMRVMHSAPVTPAPS